MAFVFEPTELPEVMEVKTEGFSDVRGRFSEVFRGEEFKQHGIDMQVAQINQSWSNHHVLRGLHYQNPPKSQAKLVTVAVGEIFDVAVDIRKGSPTYGRYISRVLSDKNYTMLYVPKGFAHGFCVLSEEAQVVYYCSDEYAPEAEGGVAWDDLALGIEWPVEQPMMSDKDEDFPELVDAENDFVYQS